MKLTVLSCLLCVLAGVEVLCNVTVVGVLCNVAVVAVLCHVATVEVLCDVAAAVAVLCTGTAFGDVVQLGTGPSVCQKVPLSVRLMGVALVAV